MNNSSAPASPPPTAMSEHTHHYQALVSALAEGNDALADKIARGDPVAGAYMVMTEMMARSMSDDDLSELIDILDEVPEAANVDLRAGVTPLICAVMNGQVDAVRTLLARAEIDVNATGLDGVSALMVASRMGRTDLIDHLGGRDELNINAISASGATALHNAAGMGHLETVRYLLERFGDRLDVDGLERGWSALDLARTAGRADVVELLEANRWALKPRIFRRG